MTKATVEVDSREELKELFKLDERIDIPGDFQVIVWDMMDIVDFIDEDGKSLQFIQDHIGATDKEYVRGLLLVLQAHDFVDNEGKLWRKYD